MPVDVHVHIIPPVALRDKAPEDTWRPRVIWKNGQQVIEFKGRRLRSAVRPIADLGALLEQQARVGVDRMVLSPWVPLLRYGLHPEEGLRWARGINEAMAEMAQAHPNHIRSLGTVPLQDPTLAARELREIMKEPGLVGVEVATSVRGTFLGDARFRPFWEAAAETGALVFIHPTTEGFNLPLFEEFYLWNTVANPLETTITAAHLILSGVLAEYPDLKVLLAHGGGALLCVSSRMDHGYHVQPLARGALEHPPSVYMRRLWVDTVVHSPHTLRTLVEWLGTSHIVLGSDYPFDMGLAEPVRALQAAGLSPHATRAILDDNICRLLGPKGWPRQNTHGEEAT